MTRTYKTGPRAGQELAQLEKARRENVQLERIALLLAERAGRDARDVQTENCAADGCTNAAHAVKAYKLAANAELAYCRSRGLAFTRVRGNKEGIT